MARVKCAELLTSFREVEDSHSRAHHVMADCSPQREIQASAHLAGTGFPWKSYNFSPAVIVVGGQHPSLFDTIIICLFYSVALLLYFSTKWKLFPPRTNRSKPTPSRRRRHRHRQCGGGGGGWMHHIGFRSHGQISHIEKKASERSSGERERDNQTNMNRRRAIERWLQQSKVLRFIRRVGFFFSLRPTEKKKRCRQFDEI